MHKSRPARLDCAFEYQRVTRKEIYITKLKANTEADITACRYWSDANSTGTSYTSHNEETYYSDSGSRQEDSELEYSLNLDETEAAVESFDTIEDVPYYRQQRTHEYIEQLQHLDWKGAPMSTTITANSGMYCPDYTLGIHHLQDLRDKCVFTATGCCAIEFKPGHEMNEDYVMRKSSPVLTEHSQSQYGQHSIRESRAEVSESDQPPSLQLPFEVHGSYNDIHSPDQVTTGPANSRGQNTFTTPQSQCPTTKAQNFTSAFQNQSLLPPRFEKKHSPSTAMLALRATKHIPKKCQEEEQRISRMKRRCIRSSKSLQRIIRQT